MKVKDLKKFLEEFDDELEVILSSDAEGNSYSPVSDSYSVGQYKPQSTWCGDFWTVDDAKDMGEEDEYKENALVLWPIN